jgi:hypothetical protein
MFAWVSVAFGSFVEWFAHGVGLGSVGTVYDVEQHESRLLLISEGYQRFLSIRYNPIYTGSHPLVQSLHPPYSLTSFDRQPLPKHRHSHRLSSFFTATFLWFGIEAEYRLPDRRIYPLPSAPFSFGLSVRVAGGEVMSYSV